MQPEIGLVADHAMNQAVKKLEISLSLFSTNKNTKFVETTVYTELFTSHRRKLDKHSTNQGSLSRHQSTYTKLFIRHKQKPEKNNDLYRVVYKS